MTGLEPATSRSQSECSTKLSYIPLLTTLYMLSSEREGNRTPDGSYVTVLQTAPTRIADSRHSLIWDISDSNRGLIG